jgi:hypothetical protein
MKFDLYSEILFNQDISEYSIKKGDIGTLVEYYPSNHINIENGYSVEIFDAYGDTLKVVTVSESKISCIKHNSVLSVREFEYA